MESHKKKNNGIKIIRKANDLIESRYRFDIWETRVFNTVLGEIRLDDADFFVYRIYLKDIIKEFGIKNGNAYDLLRAAASSLMDKKIHIDYEDNGAIREQKYHIIRKIDTLKEVLDEGRRESHEYIDLSIEPEMKPLLLELRSRFTAYDMRNIVKFRSGYTVRIYEHLKQYERIGWRDLNVDYLRRTFELTEEYPLFANFYQKIIEPAEENINAFSDIQITKIDKIKEGKSVAILRFFFRAKTKEETKKTKERRAEGKKVAQTVPLLEEMIATEPTILPLATEIDFLFSMFQTVVVGEFGVTPTAFLDLLEGKTQEQVEQAIRVTNRAKKEREIKNTAGFFVQAMKDSYTDPKEESSKRKAQEEEKKAMIAALHTEIETLKDEESLKINERIRELTLDNPEITLKAIEAVRSKNEFFVQRIEAEKGRGLEVEDFRQDMFLRQFVKQEIVEQNKDFFKEALLVFRPKISEIEETLKGLMASR
jgi:plasmid replication initiation protein